MFDLYPITLSEQAANCYQVPGSTTNRRPVVWVLPAFSFVALSGLCQMAEELRRKQDQANHEHGYTENLVFGKSFTVHKQAEHHHDKSITGSNS